MFRFAKLLDEAHCLYLCVEEWYCMVCPYSSDERMWLRVKAWIIIQSKRVPNLHTTGRPSAARQKKKKTQRLSWPYFYLLKWLMSFGDSKSKRRIFFNSTNIFLNGCSLLQTRNNIWMQTSFKFVFCFKFL